MSGSSVEQLGGALCRARRSASPGDVDLRSICSLEEARAIQEAALRCHDSFPVGYTLAATSTAVVNTLNCHTPAAGKLLEDYVYASGSSFRLPHGVLGVGAQVLFTIGSLVRRPIDLQSIADSIVSCRVGLQILGRRTAPGIPLNDWSGTADFVLDVACVRGAPEILGWQDYALNDLDFFPSIDGHEVTKRSGVEIPGGPLAAVLWLARSLQACGSALEAGDIVATGSCTGLS